MPTFWMIAGGEMQEPAAKHIKSLGLKLILSDGDPNAICRKYADEFLPLDTFDVDGHIEASKHLKKNYDIIGIATIAADCHYTVNYLAKSLGLHYLDPQISKICRNKIMTRELLAQSDLIQPIFKNFSNFEAAYQWTSQQKQALVIKATDNSGSRGFSLIESSQGLTRNQFEDALKCGTTGSVLIEERLFPNTNCISEASVETLWQNGEMRVINWVDRIFGRDLKFLGKVSYQKVPFEGVEIGHINPALRKKIEKEEVEADIKKAGVAIGMVKQSGAHILKADIFFSTKGPVILELTPRCSGGWDSSGTSRTRGARIAEGVVHLAQGKYVSDQDWKSFFTFNDEINSVALARIPKDAKNCIGREFKIFSGTKSIAELVTEGIETFELENSYV